MARHALARAAIMLYFIFGVSSRIKADAPGDPSGSEGMGVLLNQNIDARYRYDRFYTGVDRAFIGESFDWSGVGKQVTVNSGPLWATLISQDYFVTAAHTVNANYAGGVMKFYTDNTASTSVERTVASGGWNLGNDIWIGKFVPLTNPTDIATMGTIATYPILNAENYADYAGQEIYMFGQSAKNGAVRSKNQRVGRNVIDFGTEEGMAHDFDGSAADITGPNSVGDGRVDEWDWALVESQLGNSNISYLNGDVSRGATVGGTSSPGIVDANDLQVLFDELIDSNVNSSNAIGWDEAVGTPGDSGAPRFRIVDGKPALVGAAHGDTDSSLLGPSFATIRSTIVTDSSSAQSPISLTIKRGTPLATRAGVTMASALEELPYVWRGDLNGDFVEDATDIDLLNHEINASVANADRPLNWALDFDGVSGLTRGTDLQPGGGGTPGDLTKFLKLFGTVYGDTNLSGQVSLNGDGYAGSPPIGPTNGGWAAMDFNGNGSVSFNTDITPGYNNIGYRGSRSVDLDFAGNDNAITATDIDALTAEIRNGTNSSLFDINVDGVVDDDDYNIYIVDVLGAQFGDLNLSGAITYNGDGTALQLGAGGWAQGDLDGDHVVYQWEIDYVVAAFGTESQGTFPPYQVPEAGGSVMALLAVAGVGALRRRSAKVAG